MGTSPATLWCPLAPCGVPCHPVLPLAPHCSYSQGGGAHPLFSCEQHPERGQVGSRSMWHPPGTGFESPAPKAGAGTGRTRAGEGTRGQRCVGREGTLSASPVARGQPACGVLSLRGSQGSRQGWQGGQERAGLAGWAAQPACSSLGSTAACCPPCSAVLPAPACCTCLLLPPPCCSCLHLPQCRQRPVQAAGAGQSTRVRPQLLLPAPAAAPGLGSGQVSSRGLR